MGDLAQLLQLGGLADIPVVGIVVVVILAPVLAVVLVVGLPFIAIGLIEAIVLGALACAGLGAATLFGRPILVRVEPTADADGSTPDGPELVCAVRGWRASRALRDRICIALGNGADPRAVVAPAVILVGG